MTTQYSTLNIVLPEAPAEAYDMFKEAEKVSNAFTAWRATNWLGSFRDAEDRLMEAMLELTASSSPSEIQKRYSGYLAESLFILLHIAKEQNAYLLNYSSITYMEFLYDTENFNSFIQHDTDRSAVAWLSVMSAEVFADDSGAEGIVVDTLVQRLVGRYLNNPSTPTTEDVVAALYGPACWDLYGPGDGEVMASTLWNQQVPLLLDNICNLGLDIKMPENLHSPNQD